MTDKTCPFCNELPHNSDFDTYHGMRWCCTKECPLYLKVISIEQWNTRGGIKQLGADEMSMPKRIEELEAEVERLKKESAELKNLVAAAKCPCCDGFGAYYDNYGEVCQCQWCDEAKEAKERYFKQIKAEAVREFASIFESAINSCDGIGFKDLTEVEFNSFVSDHAARLEGDKP